MNVKNIAYVCALALAAVMTLPASVQAELDTANSDGVCDSVDHYHSTPITNSLEYIYCHDEDNDDCGGGVWYDVDGDGTATGDEATEWFVFCKSRNDA